MPRLCLPPEPNLEHLKGQAKALRHAALGGDPAALGMVRELHPDAADLVGDPPSRRFALADAQLTVARLYGFTSWARLRSHLDAVDRYGRSPHRAGPAAGEPDVADALLRSACLVYGHEDRGRALRARALLAHDPGIGRASIHAAAAIGDVGAVAAHLDRNGEAATAEGGPFRWAPLLYAAYSRLDSPDPAHSTLAAARLLLEAGADANTGYLWAGECLFTALTGAFGGGEDDQQAHRDGPGLARLLLAAGADPNDTQTLYNLGMAGTARDTVEHLELLLEYGLGAGKGSVWDRRLGEAPAPNVRLLNEELLTAARRGLPARARLLLRHGVEVDVREVGHPFYSGRTPYQLAVLHGHVEVARLLADAGATTDLDPLEAAMAALMAGDGRQVAGVIRADPAAVDRLRELRPNLVARAAEAGNAAAVRVLAEHGWDVNAVQRTSALHEAALRGDLDTVRLLVELGADPDVLDTEFSSTPLGWATHGGHQRVVAYLTPRTSAPPG